MSNLVEHAQRELEIAGLFDRDSDYGGMIGHAVMRVVKAFAEDNHSGASAALTRHIAMLLLDFQPLSPLTNEPSEWEEHTNGPTTMHQSRRSPIHFSDDGLQTYYTVEGDDAMKARPLGSKQ